MFSREYTFNLPEIYVFRGKEVRISWQRYTYIKTTKLDI